MFFEMLTVALYLSVPLWTVLLSVMESSLNLTMSFSRAVFFLEIGILYVKHKPDEILISLMT